MNQGRPLNRISVVWDRNGSTSDPTHDSYLMMMMMVIWVQFLQFLRLTC